MTLREDYRLRHGGGVDLPAQRRVLPCAVGCQAYADVERGGAASDSARHFLRLQRSSHRISCAADLAKALTHPHRGSHQPSINAQLCHLPRHRQGYE